MIQQTDWKDIPVNSLILRVTQLPIMVQEAPHYAKLGSPVNRTLCKQVLSPMQVARKVVGFVHGTSQMAF
jgi:hypothetical protein